MIKHARPTMEAHLWHCLDNQIGIQFRRDYPLKSRYDKIKTIIGLSMERDADQGNRTYWGTDLLCQFD